MRKRSYVYLKTQLPNSPPFVTSREVNFNVCDITARLDPTFTFTYKNNDNNGMGDPLVQYTIKIFQDNPCDADKNGSKDLSCGGNNDQTTPMTSADNLLYTATINNFNSTTGKYDPIPSGSGNGTIGDGGSVSYTYNGALNGGIFNYRQSYYFTVTVQDEQHLE